MVLIRRIWAVFAWYLAGLMRAAGDVGFRREGCDLGHIAGWSCFYSLDGEVGWMGAAYTPGAETTSRGRTSLWCVAQAKTVRRLIRHWVQGVFLLLNVWIGIEFVIWARFFETRGASAYIQRPAGVDGWLPIAGLMNLKYFLLAHQDAEHPSGSDGAGCCRFCCRARC